MINSNAKGKRRERELAAILRDNGYSARRSQQYNGQAGDADLVGLEGIHVEVKAVEKLNIQLAMEQAERDRQITAIPTVFHKRNGKPWLVTMTLDDWLEFYERWLME